jgi:hypothetical protein
MITCVHSDKVFNDGGSPPEKQAIVLLSIAAVVHTIQASGGNRRMHRAGSKALLVSAPLIIVLGFVERKRLNLLVDHRG